MYKKSLHLRVFVAEMAALYSTPKCINARIKLDVNFLGVL